MSFYVIITIKNKLKTFMKVKMNGYLKNLEKIEFVVTNACTGRCKYCSQGDHSPCGKVIDTDVASDIVRQVAGLYNIKNVMTFGAEPLLYPDVVYAIHRARQK